jgi:hypothetical protein
MRRYAVSQVGRRAPTRSGHPFVEGRRASESRARGTE